MRHEVVGEHRESVEVVEAPEGRAPKGDGQVGSGELRSLQYGHAPSSIGRHVPVHRHGEEEVDEALGAPACLFDQRLEGPFIVLEEEPSQLVQRLGEVRHQTVDRRTQRLPEELCALRDRDRRQFFDGKRAGGGEAVP